MTRCWLLWLNKYRDSDAWMDSSLTKILGLVFGSALTGIIFVFAVLALFELPTLMLNPQYWALKEILSNIK